MSTTAIVCRSCSARDLHLVLDLGTTPLANSPPTTEQLALPEERFPLRLYFCPRCALVQIDVTVPPETLFRDYLYFSSFSDAALAHARTLATRLIAERSLDNASLVIEVASNDGYLLQYYREAGIAVLGIEPARNIAKVAVERGIPTISEFFGLPLATKLGLENKRAQVIHANNVLAHVADTNGFVAGFAELLAPGGIAVIEAPYVGEMIERCEFDTIYHEHLCYFSLHSLERLFERHGLRIHDVERVAIHGGSLRIFVSRNSESMPRTSAVEQLRAHERSAGMHLPAYYDGFATSVGALRSELRSLLARLKAEGKSIAAYGAAAKGSTLLNSFEIGADTLDFVADRSTYKQGRHMPGVHVPIVPPTRLLEAQPDYVLLLTWNFAEEIIGQQRAYLEAGGHFIVPVPRPTIVGAGGLHR